MSTFGCRTSENIFANNFEITIRSMQENFFHILNRGVEKRKIFLNQEDYLRFIYNLDDFNDKNNVNLAYSYRRENHKATFGSRTSENSENSARQEDRLVDILCCCLMPNHFHVFAQEKTDGGAGLFAKKITGGYTLFFNPKNDRQGVLFQGRSKIILIEENAHFLYLPYYVFSNPIKLIEPDWKENGIKDFNKVIRFLENYENSSFPDIIGHKGNFSDVINKDLFYKLFDTNPQRFRKEFIEWLKDYRGREFADEAFKKFE